MSFSSDPSKQSQEAIKKPNYPVLIFNNIQVNQTPHQKHLGMCLDNKLNSENMKGTLLTKIINQLDYYVNCRWSDQDDH